MSDKQPMPSSAPSNASSSSSNRVVQGLQIYQAVGEAMKKVAKKPRGRSS